jgi:DamX protein
MIASRSAVKRPSMGFNMPKKHVLAISAVVVVAVAAAWLMPGRSKAPTTGAPTNEQAQLPLGTPKPNSGGAPAVEFAGNTQPMPLPLVGQSQPVMRGPLAEAAGGITEGDDGVPVEGSSAKPPTVTTTAPPVGIPAGPTPAPAAKPAPAPTQVATAKPAPAPAPAAKPAPVAKPATVAKPVEKPVEKPANVAKAATGGTWYAGQAPGNYVVQILGTSSEATAQNFVKEQGGEYRYFKKVLNGKPLYVITYGNFANRDAAVTAIKALPAKVQAGKPWPRTVASVQQELATTR